MKRFLRKILNKFKLDLTKNLRYDRLSMEILKNNLNHNSNCIDVGCHKGEFLDMILRFAPKGKHFCFEPIPSMFSGLVLKYKHFNNVKILPYAVGKIEGVTDFNLVIDSPAYSGLKIRDYKKPNPKIDKIKVNVTTLDEVIQTSVDFIKIDVEGGEYDVLLGASKILEKDKPLILFEFGLGASDFYGTTPKEIYTFLEEKEYQLYSLKSFLKNAPSYSFEEFEKVYELNKEYYFLAK